MLDSKLVYGPYSLSVIWYSKIMWYGFIPPCLEVSHILIPLWYFHLNDCRSSVYTVLITRHAILISVLPRLVTTNNLPKFDGSSPKWPLVTSRWSPRVHCLPLEVGRKNNNQYKYIICINLLFIYLPRHLGPWYVKVHT